MLIAHLVNTGFGPFYDGITHLAMTPEDILPVLALAALAGLGGAARGRTLLALLPAAWLLGGLLGLRHDAEISMPIVATLSFLVPGALVAADIRLPSIVVGGLALGIGVLHGYLNGTAMSVGGGVVGLAGIVSAVFVALTLIAAFVVSLEPQWARVAVRVSGSWIAAIGLLMLGWSLRGAVG
jgi:hydrogenase/urease accessory protein HupE